MKVVRITHQKKLGGKNISTIDCGSYLARTEYFVYHQMFYLGQVELTKHPQNLIILKAIAYRDKYGPSQHLRTYTCKLRAKRVLSFIEENSHIYPLKDFFLAFADKFITSKPLKYVGTRPQN